MKTMQGSRIGRAVKSFKEQKAVKPEKQNVVRKTAVCECSCKDIVSEDDQVKIARKAYELFEQRGCECGHDLDDWLEAERIVKGIAAP